MTPLNSYVQAWSESARAVQEVCARLGADDWELPTDCPRWRVRDVVAHLAALETELTAGEGAAPTGGTVVVSDHTEAGVRARAGDTPDQLLAEFAEAVDARVLQLRELPADPTAPAPRTPAGVAWDWQTLLRNRAVDLWVHEQDVRRAVGDAGGFDGTGVQVVTETFAGAMPYVLGKLVAPPAGTTAVWDVTGPVPFVLPLAVGDDGRAHRLDSPPSEPDATLRMGTEAFTVLAAGRHPRSGVAVELAGDVRLCGSILAAMAVTP